MKKLLYIIPVILLLAWCRIEQTSTPVSMEEESGSPVNMACKSNISSLVFIERIDTQTDDMYCNTLECFPKGYCNKTSRIISK